MSTILQSKREECIKWIKMPELNLLFLKETDVKYKEQIKSKLKSWENIHHINYTNKKVVPMFRSGKLDSLPKNITEAKESYLVMIKGVIHQGDIMILNMYDLTEFKNS